MALPRYSARMWNDFKAFAFKGNVVDLAVGVVIGGAFGKIVSALVDAIIMPLIQKLLKAAGAANFGRDEKGVLHWLVGGIDVGQFLGAIFDFMIIAAVLFIVVSAIKKVTDKPAAPAAPPEPPAQEKLLAEIRDLLKK